MHGRGQGNFHFPCSVYRYNQDRHLDGLVFRGFAPPAVGSRFIIAALVHLKPTTRTSSSGRAITFIPLQLLSSSQISWFIIQARLLYCNPVPTKKAGAYRVGRRALRSTLGCQRSLTDRLAQYNCCLLYKKNSTGSTVLTKISDSNNTPQICF